MNLIFCTTPLQVLIAERIIAQNPDEQFDAIMLSYVDNDKYRYYYERLAKVCRRAERLIQRDLGKFEAYIDALRTLMWSYRLPRYRAVYCSSIDSSHIQLGLTFHRRAQLYTYDDGLVNLDAKAWAETMVDYDGGFNRLLKQVFGKPSVADIIARSQKHYTIYRLPNVMPRAEYLPLFEPVRESDSQTIERTVRLMLGQMVYLDDVEKSRELTEQVISTYQIDQYLPHPKENYQVDGVQYVHTPLIFEDYIAQELASNPTTHYEVYVFFSTPSVNLAGVHPRLSFVSIKPDDVPEIFLKSYDIIAQVGVPIIPFPNTIQNDAE